MKIIRVDRVTGDGPIAGHDTSLLHHFGATAEQGVPGGERSALQNTPVGTGLRKPAVLFHGFRRQLDAHLVDKSPGLIDPAPGAREVQVLTGHGGHKNSAGLRVFKLLHATESTPVTKGFPLLACHSWQGCALPERGVIVVVVVVCVTAHVGFPLHPVVHSLGPLHIMG